MLDILLLIGIASLFHYYFSQKTLIAILAIVVLRMGHSQKARRQIMEIYRSSIIISQFLCRRRQCSIRKCNVPGHATRRRLSFNGAATTIVCECFIEAKLKWRYGYYY